MLLLVDDSIEAPRGTGMVHDTSEHSLSIKKNHQYLFMTMTLSRPLVGQHAVDSECNGASVFSLMNGEIMPRRLLKLGLRNW